jgi:hypothetical protein
MMSAARKLQSLGFLVLLLAIFSLIYPLSLQVATTRSDVLRVERDILSTRENIRYLETELGARASLRQLERWNVEVFGYTAPTASQYLAGEQELASVNSREIQGGMPVVAPVLTAMAAQPATASFDGGVVEAQPSAAAQGLQVAQQVAVPSPRENPVVMAARDVPSQPVRAQQASGVKLIPEAKAAKPQGPSGKSASGASLAKSAEQRRAERTAMIEDQMLGIKSVRPAAPKAAPQKLAAIKPAAPAKASQPKIATKPATKPQTKPIVKPATKPAVKPQAQAQASSKPLAKPTPKSKAERKP